MSGVMSIPSPVKREFFEDIYGVIRIPVNKGDILLDNGMILKQEQKVEQDAYKGCFNANGVEFPYMYTAVRFSSDKKSKVVGYLKV